jgi:tRNA-2-methylthio-N6-dimethylallyladenosine synthase
MDGQVPPEVVKERFDALVSLQEDITLAENRQLLDADVEVLLAQGEGRKDAASDRMSGRARDGRLVHVDVDGLAERPRPGDMVSGPVTYAAPHHLVARGVSLRKTRAGDAYGIM